MKHSAATLMILCVLASSAQAGPVVVVRPVIVVRPPIVAHPASAPAVTPKAVVTAKPSSSLERAPAVTPVIVTPILPVDHTKCSGDASECGTK